MPQPTGYCHKCGYPIDPGQCPECGLINNHPSRLSLKQRRNRRRRRIFLGFLIILGLGSAGWFNRKLIFQRAFPNIWLIAIEDAKGSWATWATKALDERTSIQLKNAQESYHDRQARFDDQPIFPSSVEWAGQYGGDIKLPTVRLSVSPNLGFQLETTGGGAIIALGTVKVNDDSTLCFLSDLSPALLTRRAARELLKKPILTDHMYIIRGPRVMFLVPDHALRQFCVDVSARKQLWDRYLGRFRGATYKSRYFGDPTAFSVPKEFEPYLLAEPITATVLTVRDIRIGTTVRFNVQRPSARAEIVLNVGRDHGILPGMEFFAPRYSKSAQARVRTVSEHNCTLDYADVSMPIQFKPLQEPQVPTPDWTMTTRSEGRDDGWYWYFGLDEF